MTPHCDFCSDPSPMWVYPAADVRFVAGGAPVLESTGAWLACAACHALIACGDTQGLEDRAVASIATRLPVLARDILRAWVRAGQVGFRDARFGAPRPLEATS